MQLEKYLMKSFHDLSEVTLNLHLWTITQLKRRHWLRSIDFQRISESVLKKYVVGKTIQFNPYPKL